MNFDREKMVSSLLLHSVDQLPTLVPTAAVGKNRLAMTSCAAAKRAVTRASGPAELGPSPTAVPGSVPLGARNRTFQLCGPLQRRETTLEFVSSADGNR